jgi:SPX domain protein involved in polyphosphate accumulation
VRLESKFVSNISQLNHFLTWLHSSKLVFKRHYTDRKINSFYYDTITNKSISDNIDGISNRDKLRLRWYGENRLPNDCTLEIKHKRNSVGFKSNLHFKNLINFNCHNSLRNILIKNSNGLFKEYLKFYSFPVSLITYDRSYYRSINKKIRLTIDSDISYFKQYNNNFNFHNTMQLNPSIIIEFKFDICDRQFLSHNLQDFPFRISKNSKYVNSQLLNS